MILFTDSIFLTDEIEGFRQCRENRSTASNTMTVLLCTAGYIDVYYHEEMIRIHKNDLWVRIPDFNYQMGPYEMSPDFEFKQVTVDAAIFEQIMFDHMRIEPNWWTKQEYIKEHPIFPINEKSIEFFDSYFHLLTLQLQDKMSSLRKQILMMIARAATMEMLNYMDKLSVGGETTSTRTTINHSDYIFHQFIRLLQKHPHAREVQWYAQQLDITPKYLSEICKERSDKAAGEWIADITVSELKHYLRNTTLPIREIARLMEFPNASFFCQYTKKHLGVSPNKYRRSKKAQ